jgi:hypothetical protein
LNVSVGLSARREDHEEAAMATILKAPNDQYLCIVPTSRDESSGGVFLPFEGDRVLSINLSKAFMLAEDSKITDTSITSQLRKS